jgi:hypothetical protein
MSSASVKTTLKFPDTSAHRNEGAYATRGIIQSSPSIELEPNKRRIGTRCEYIEVSEVSENDGLYFSDGASPNQPRPIMARHELLSSPCAEKARRTGDTQVIDPDGSPPADHRRPRDSRELPQGTRKTTGRANIQFTDDNEPLPRKGNANANGKRRDDAEPPQDKGKGKGHVNPSFNDDDKAKDEAPPRNANRRDDAEPPQDKGKGKGHVNISFNDDDEDEAPPRNGKGHVNILFKDDDKDGAPPRNGKHRDEGKPLPQNNNGTSKRRNDAEPPQDKHNSRGRGNAKPSQDERKSKDKTHVDPRDNVAQRGRGQYAKSKFLLSVSHSAQY